MITVMFKYFDNTFFKFFFGFLGIVFASLVLLATTQYFSNKHNANQIQVDDTLVQDVDLNQ